MTQFVLPDEKLQQLLFWASIGVRSSNGGNYKDSIADVINEAAVALGYELGEYTPVFGADRNGGIKAGALGTDSRKR